METKFNQRNIDNYAFCIKTDEGFYAKDGYFSSSFIDAQLFQKKQTAELPANTPFLKNKNAKIFAVILEECK